MMSILAYELFFLPIHRRSYNRYYEEHNKYVAERKRALEFTQQMSCDQLSREKQAYWDEQWFWPPWKFNDIVGFLDLGLDGGTCLTADVFLRRKAFPKGSRERIYGRGPVMRNNEFLYYSEIGKVPVEDLESNESYLKAVRELLGEAKKTIKERNATWHLCLPRFDFDCFDFVRAYKQVKKEKP